VKKTNLIDPDESVSINSPSSTATEMTIPKKYSYYDALQKLTNNNPPIVRSSNFNNNHDGTNNDSNLQNNEKPHEATCDPKSCDKCKRQLD